MKFLYLCFRYKNVFIHGDLWTNNLLFRKDKNGKVNHAIIIDFQLARYAPPAHDLLMFLHLVQNKSFLDLHQQELFRYYYEAFAQELQKNSIDVEAILPWKIFSESCDFYQDLGLICKLFYFQLILIPEELLGKFMNTPESFMRNMMVDRSELALACFAKSESYKARVTEALNEVIKKFILIPVKN